MHTLYLNMHMEISCYVIKWDGNSLYLVCWSQECVGEVHKSDAHKILNLHKLQEDV